MRQSVKIISPYKIRVEINGKIVALDKDSALKLSGQLMQQANKIGRIGKIKRNKRANK